MIKQVVVDLIQHGQCVARQVEVAAAERMANDRSALAK